MDEFFQIIQKDIAELENSLAYQVPFFKDKGNVYLVADNKRKNEVLLEEYITFCKLSINNEELKNLKPIAQVYRTTLVILATKMNIDWQKDRTLAEILSDNPVDFSGSELIRKFANIRQQTQILLTELNSYLINSFSLRLVPPASVQESINKDLKNFDFNADDVEVLIDISGLKTDGVPDLNKIASEEIKSNRIKILISSNAEVLDKYELLDQLFRDDLKNEIIADVVSVTLDKVYTEIYSFIYSQIFVNKLTTEAVLKNTVQKFGAIKPLFMQNFHKVVEIVKSDLSLGHDYDIDRRSGEFIKDFDRYVKEEQMFSTARAKVYNLQIRQANDFEHSLYNSRVCFDCFLMLEQEQGANILVATLALVWAPQVYELSAILICGAQYNKSWGDKIIAQVGMNEIQKLISDEAILSQSKEATRNYEKYLTNIV